jgi:ankyrin repeat protein
VSGGPPFLTAQLPLKFILLSLVFGTVYVGIIRPKLADRGKEQDFRRALGNQDASGVRKAVENGARLDTPVGDGTALISASQQGNLEVCHYLLSQGAEVNRKNLQGETALIVALKNAHPEVAQELVDSGADVNLPDGHGQTPLMLAAQLDNTSVVEALLAKHAEINHVILYGSYSPLLAAVNYRRARNVELLLRSGADPNLAPPGGPSPLAQARMVGDQPIVDLLSAQAAK